MARAARNDLVVARTSFWVGKLLVQVGEIWAADDPVVAGNPRAFGPLVIRTSIRPVERSA